MNILLVDDQEDQAMLVKAAFEVARIEAVINYVSGGVECLAYLRKELDYSAVRTPDLILLDLNMPQMNGFQVLEHLAADFQLKHIPVVVLTTSTNPTDVRKCYSLGCNSYISKPFDFDELAKAMGLMYRYWFHLAALPSPQ
ncbi:MAG: response regulator [Polaromonas sp.]|nr:response regulator [Polaromonas sp.]